MKVYVASEGSYSDYRVVVVFGDREQAEAEQTLNHEWNDIEEFTFIPAGERVLKRIVYEASWWRGRSEMHVVERIEYGTEEAFFDVPAGQPYVYGDGNYVVSAKGTDRERVVKSVADRMAGYKARSEGLA